MKIEIVIVRIVTNVSLLVIGIIMNDVFVQVLRKKYVRIVTQKTLILETVFQTQQNVLRENVQNDGRKTLKLENVKTQVKGSQYLTL